MTNLELEQTSHPTRAEIFGMNRFLTATLAAVLLLMGLPASGHALSKTIGGSACQVSDGSNLILGRGTNDIGSAGGAYTAVCSLIRDNTTNTNGLYALRVRVIKADSTSRTCTARSHDSYGNLLKSVSRSVSGTGLRTFNWTNTLNASSSTAYYTVTCSMGGGDTIKNLYWDEPLPFELFGDAKIMPGNLCKSSGYAPMVRDTSRITAGPGGFGGTFVQCGPLRDTFSFFSTLTDLKVRVYNGPLDDMGCQGVIGDSYDNYLLSKSLEPSGVGNATLDYGTSLNGWAFFAQYGVECWLNSNSDAIYSVSWRE